MVNWGSWIVRVDRRRAAAQAAAADGRRDLDRVEAVDGGEERRERHPDVAPVGRDDRGDGEGHAVGERRELRHEGHRAGADDRGRAPRRSMIVWVLKIVAAAPLKVVTFGAWRMLDRVSPWAAVRKR